MNKKHLLLASALLLTAAGCTDASAKLNDSSTVLITVGKQTITKGDVYSLMNATAGATIAIDNATKAICDAEVEITDEMKETAESTLNSYKSIYGDTFTSYLESVNMTEDDYLNDYLIPSLQAEELTTCYIEQNWDSVVDLYKPVMATILSFETDDDASAALSELNDGSSTAAEAAAGHNSSSSGTSVLYTIDSDDVDSLVRTVLTSASPDDGWAEVPSSDGGTYYLVKVDDDDPENFKEDFITELKSISQISSDSSTYFFKKYNFVIYDKTIYDAVASDYPDYLVQNIQDTEDTSAEE